MINDVDKAIKHNIDDMLQNRVSNIPIRLVIDLDMDSPPLFLFPEFSGLYSGIKIVEKEQIPMNISEYNGIKISDKITNGGFLIPEFQSLLLFTTSFEELMTRYILKEDKENKLKQIWVAFVMSIEAFTLNSKTKAIQKYASTKKQKGLSRVELDKYNNTQIPIFITPDTLKISTLTDYDVEIIKQYVKINNDINRELHKIFGESLEINKAVYYQGGRIYGKESTESTTTYVPKMDLVSKGYDNALEALFEICQKILKE